MEVVRLDDEQELKKRRHARALHIVKRFRLMDDGDLCHFHNGK